MLGAIIGDIVGSRFEFRNLKSKNFEFLHPNCFITDDSVLSLAICEALLDSADDWDKLEARVTQSMWQIGRKYIDSGFGGMFLSWLETKNPKPYGSYGNGSAMRVSGCGYVSDSRETVKNVAHIVTAVTHNHPEGLKGAEATAIGVYLARQGQSLASIKEALLEYYPIDFTLDEIRPTYQFTETCQGTMPYALEALFESNSFEDAIRNAISIGGDSDTIGAIVGGIAEPYFGIPAAMREAALKYIPDDLREILERFEAKYPPKII